MKYENKEYECLDSIEELNIGENKGKLLYVKSLMPLSKQPPVSFLAVDTSGDVFSLSVYHLNDVVLEKIRHERDIITLKDPVLRKVSYKGNEFPLIHIKKPHKFLVNDQILKENFAHAAMTTKNSF